MGSKAAVVVFGEAEPKRIFRDSAVIDRVKSQRLAEMVLGATLHEADFLALDLALWPDSGMVCAASLPEYEVVCSRELARRQPSELTEWISQVASGRDAYAVSCTALRTGGLSRSGRTVV